MPTPHRWKFFRAGGVDQVMLRDGADVVHLDELDQKLWVALAMPTRGVELDARTLDLLDLDGDGRIRVPEILAAVKWVKETLVEPGDLLKRSDVVPLSAIREGPVRAGARRILTNLGKADAVSISLAEVADTAKIFAATRFNGDGVVPVESAEDPEVRRALEDIIAVNGPVPDRSTRPGVDGAGVDLFFKEARALADWQAKGEADPAVLPLGEATAAAAGAVRAVKAKVDDAFIRFRLAAFDARMVAPLNRVEAELIALGAKELALDTGELQRLPLSKVEAGRALPLAEGVNPAWAGPLAELQAKAIGPLLGAGKTALTEAEWGQVLSKLAPFEAWQATRPATKVEKLGMARVKELLSGGAKAAIDALIAQDKALEPENAQIVSVERLVRYQRDLFRLLNNFVSFSEFYGRKGAIFQVGTLYLDGRSCDLCVNVADTAKHGSLAALASTCLAYCECTRPNGEKMTIAAAFTDGDADHLIVGRNGIFYDHAGRDWDATIAKLVSHPISLREAFWSPYKKFVRMVEDQINKRALAADAESHAKVSDAAVATAQVDKAKREEKKIDVGTVAAIGVAIGGIGAMLTGVLAAFFGLGSWMPLGILALLLLVSGPAMLLAWLKLRQRNLGPILDANGWAINGRARINVAFGAALTHVAALPKKAERTLKDPYADKSRPWLVYGGAALALALAVSWYLGKLDSLLPPGGRSVSVLGPNAPAWVEPPHAQDVK
ncbi:MAG: hypothetical protein ACYC8T_24925 [Myxococcaceae bacterium]